MASVREGRGSVRFFDAIVGLRIYLALWVALGHGLEFTGILQSKNPVLRILLSNGDAVVVFMIVSGFVIASLLINKRECYPQYITRRFFRLYPAYVLACVVGYFVMPQWVYLVQHVPWQSMAGWHDYAAGVTDMQNQVANNFWPHFFAHLTMLHGLFPSEVLDRSATTFLPAAWSISLEWQFYLLAPLVIAAVLGKGWRLVGVVAVAFVALVLFRTGKLGHYQFGSSILFQGQYFAIGIASRLGFEALAKYRVSALAAAAVADFMAVTLLADPLPIVVWSTFYCFMVWGRGAGVLNTTFRIATTSRVVLLLGEASYSLYLIHRLIQVLLGSWYVHHFTPTKPTMFAVQCLAILLAMGLSLLSYFQLERRGNVLGAALAKRLPSARQGIAPEPPPATM